MASLERPAPLSFRKDTSYLCTVTAHEVGGSVARQLVATPDENPYFCQSDDPRLTRLEMEQQIRDKIPKRHYWRLISVDPWGLSKLIAFDKKFITILHWLLDQMVMEGWITGDILGFDPQKESDEAEWTQFKQKLEAFVQAKQAVEPEKEDGIQMKNLGQFSPPPSAPPTNNQMAAPPPVPSAGPPVGNPPRVGPPTGLPPVGAPPQHAPPTPPPQSVPTVMSPPVVPVTQQQPPPMASPPPPSAAPRRGRPPKASVPQAAPSASPPPPSPHPGLPPVGAHPNVHTAVPVPGPAVPNNLVALLESLATDINAHNARVDLAISHLLRVQCAQQTSGITDVSQVNLKTILGMLGYQVP